MRVDATKPDNVQRMVAAAVERFGQVDILLNNAGFGGPHAALADTEEELSDEILVLASDEASFVTGAALAVDGGYPASGPTLARRRD